MGLGEASLGGVGITTTIPAARCPPRPAPYAHLPQSPTPYHHPPPPEKKPHTPSRQTSPCQIPIYQQHKTPKLALNKKEWWRKGGNLNVYLRSDVMGRLMEDEGLRLFAHGG